MINCISGFFRQCCGIRSSQVLWLLMVLALNVSGAQRAIRRSDVVFMYDNPKLYEVYGCTVLGWAGAADPQRIALAHRKGLRLYAAHIGFRTEFRRVIDFRPDFMQGVCRDLDGKPITVPWLWDHKYKGQPAWHWCTNSPFYRSYLETRLKEVAAARPDGLQIDDYTGTAGPAFWGLGCFCRYCMEGFRKYLVKSLPPSRFKELGIKDPSSFDYAEFLRARGWTQQSFRKNRRHLPLYKEFLDFQLKEATAFVARYHRKLCRLAGSELTLSVNSSMSRPEALAIAPYLSYFCCEVSHQARSRKPPTHPIAVYKLGDGLNKPVASTAGGTDWDFVKEHNLPGLVRTWICLSYAFGHTFMAPHRQWCYSPKKGTHWYTGPTEEYAFLYRFVRRNASLFDNYEAVAHVAVLYDNAARRRGKGDIEGICIELAKENVPFTVVVSGDKWLPMRLRAEQLSDYKYILIPPDIPDSKLPAILRGSPLKEKILRWPAARPRVLEYARSLLVIRGTDQVMAVARRIPRDDSAPCVIHLLNRSYNSTGDSMNARPAFNLQIDRRLFGRLFTKAELTSPRMKKRRLRVRNVGDKTEVKIPSLRHWAIISLKP